MDCNWLTNHHQVSLSCWARHQRYLRGLAAVSGFLTLVVVASPAFGQLRTGREQRSLYHERLVEERQSNRGNQKADRQVVPASYQQPPTANSIMEDSSTVGSGIVSESPVYESVTSEETHSGYMSGGSCGCGGSGGGLVSGGRCGCDDFADIAPTCASGCGIADGCDPFLFGGPLTTLISRMTIRAEVPLYWRRAAGPPALVSTSTLGGTGSANLLLGNTALDDSATAGFRLVLGTSLTADGRYGLLFRYWNAGKQDDTYNFDSTQFPTLTRPFRNTTTVAAGVPDSQIIAQNTATAESNGNISVQSRSEVDGVNFMLQSLLYRDRFTKVEALYGYQYLRIDEQLAINSNTNVVQDPNPFLEGTSIAVSDNFATTNTFNGVVYGLMGSREIGRLRFESTVRLGIGNMHQRANISGSTTTTSAPPTRISNTTNQGLLARNTNSIPYDNNVYTVIPEVGINAAYCIRRGLDFNVGYNYMLIPKVGQASRQINSNLAVNLSDPLTGSPDPALNYRSRNYWLNSLGLGLQWKY